MITGNRGEWSEIYALFKLLSDQQLFIGDVALKKVDEIFYPIIKIVRSESGSDFEYELNGDLVIISGSEETLRIPITAFIDKAEFLLKTIKDSSGTFSIPNIEAFMSSIHCQSLKAKSSSKTDVRIIIHDQRINQQVNLGFSIKSQLGGDSTLLNAGRTTNLIYQIENFNPISDQVNFINEIDTRSKIKDRIEEIKKLGGNLKFIGLENNIFKNNLILIDSQLPNIISELLKSFFSSPLSSLKDLCENINRENPLNYDNQFAHTFYEYKIKRFLTDIALGMMPAKVWSGLYDATGGYLIVKENGDILCYHIYNKNQFENYLFENTKFETASSTRHGFGKIYFENGNYFFKLNLQIRFT
ncbi:MAG: HpaII family restriction endonuclease [Bacteroidota bacterium]